MQEGYRWLTLKPVDAARESPARLPWQQRRASQVTIAAAWQGQGQAAVTQWSPAPRASSAASVRSLSQ